MHTPIDPMDLEHSLAALQGAAHMIGEAIDRASDSALEALLRDAARVVETEIANLGALADRIAPRSRLRPEDLRWCAMATEVLR